MTELRNDRLLRALLRQPVDCTPIWVMRQAGRYLPEYRQVRKTAGDFMSLCRNPELACEVTLQPLARFALDAAIVFSDILTIPDAMGLGLHFVEGEGPRFHKPLRSSAEIAALGIPDPEQELAYVCDAVRLIRHELDGAVPLIGFAGSPWTLATYMVEGGPSKNFSIVKGLMYDVPRCMHMLLEKLAEAVTIYLNAQIAAGAQAVMIFDTWGGILSPYDYHDFSLNYMSRILNDLTWEHEGRRVPVTLFTKNGNQWLELIADSGCDCVSLDWTIEIGEARARIGEHVSLQGNLDPCVLYSTPQRIQEEVEAILDSYGPGPGHIFNLGHGILPDVPPENVEILVDAVHEISMIYHQYD